MAAHRIRRLRWKVRLGSREEAFAIRPRIRDRLSAAVLAELERVFDSVPLGDDVLRIDRLEAVVRLSRGDDLERACVDAVGRQFAERLEAAAVSRLPFRKHQADERVDARQHRRDGLLRYLQTGLLPWHFDSGGGGAAGLLAESARDGWASMTGAIPQGGSEASLFVFRLAALLPEAAWIELARHLSEHPSYTLGPLVVAAVEGVAAPAGGLLTRHVRLQIAAALITVASRQERVAGAARELSCMTGEAADAAAARFARLPEIAALFRAPDVPPEPDFASEPVEDAGVPAVPIDPGPSGSTSRGLAQPDSLDLPRPRSIEGAASSRGPQAGAMPVGLVLQHAGLVLLVPFLPRLFETRSIVSAGDERLDPPVLPRACALLHFAATGSDEGHEFEVGFAKILLGLRPGTPLPFASELLAQEDRDAVDELLQAVIGHWRVLKRTSVAGLRAAFLQRPGVVQEDDQYWRVRMEPSSIDLLLDHLPWGISTGTLPWVSKPILTEWTAR